MDLLNLASGYKFVITGAVLLGGRARRRVREAGARRLRRGVAAASRRGSCRWRSWSARRSLGVLSRRRRCRVCARARPARATPASARAFATSPQSAGSTSGTAPFGSACLPTRPRWSAAASAGSTPTSDGWLDLFVVNGLRRAATAARWSRRGGLPTIAPLPQRWTAGSPTSARDSGADLAVRGQGCVAADLDRDGRHRSLRHDRREPACCSGTTATARSPRARGGRRRRLRLARGSGRRRRQRRRLARPRRRRLRRPERSRSRARRQGFPRRTSGAATCSS